MGSTKWVNHEAEQAVLGAILLDGGLIQECILQSNHFPAGIHQMIFKAMREVDEKNLAIDVVTVSSALGDVIRQVGGVTYLSALADSVPSTANFNVYQQLILEAYKLRETRNLATQLAMNPEHITDYYQRISEIQEVISIQSRTMKHILVEIYQDMETDIEGI
ncbi:DnaB-like helicase N-terminal domain-containing protein [Bacillus sp. Marseille-P3661]|uniref:DnaB-like helicase N-terminal domain-containing protein n=1 Tax=Bacillus sp. Marseille-P3661 TaxID=1936234 RepID=UPI0027E3F95B|nr:DnaB-like helicase N-terminal domain-containing protein [Bacillus sp. Marseille-P3661]